MDWDNWKGSCKAAGLDPATAGLPPHRCDAGTIAVIGSNTERVPLVVGLEVGYRDANLHGRGKVVSLETKNVGSPGTHCMVEWPGVSGPIVAAEWIPNLGAIPNPAPKAKMHYTVQCTDHASGKVGDFGFDKAQADADRFFTAITPIFDNLQDFFIWARNNGITLDHGPYNYPTEGPKLTPEELAMAFELSHSAKRVTLPEMEKALNEIGYTLDRTLDCRSVNRWMTGEMAGHSYQAVNMTPKQMDNGIGAYHIDARRDDNFRKLQKLRQEMFAFNRGRIYSL